MGGGGFSMEPDNPALDDYVLSLTDAPEPRVCLLPTASGDGEGQIRQFHATFGARACEPTHIALFRLGRRPIPLRETLLAQDIVYVGGGSMLGPARRRARARPGRDPARVLGGGRGARRPLGRSDVLVRVGDLDGARPPGAGARAR